VQERREPRAEKVAVDGRQEARTVPGLTRAQVSKALSTVQT